MVSLLKEVEPGAYQREACLSHHLISCVSRLLDLKMGARDKLLRPEVPTFEQYRWTGRDRRAGNVDFVLIDTAIEVNKGYYGLAKISQDLIKLLDEPNGFSHSVYLAFGHPNFRTEVKAGYSAALTYLLTKHSALLLSRMLDIIVIEDGRTCRRRGSLQAWEANVELLDGRLDWHELSGREDASQ